MKPLIFKIALTAILTWAGLILMVLLIPPVNTLIQLFVLLILFIALSALLTLLFYGVMHTLTDKHLNQNQIFEDCMRRAVLISLLLSILALLKLATALTPTTGFLLVGAILGIEYYFIKTRV